MGTAVIIHSRRRWSARQRAAACGAVLASALLPWWLASSPAATQATAPAAARTPPVERMAPESARPAPMAAAATIAKPPVADSPVAPYRYAGQWRDGRRTAVVLGRQGVSVVVWVPGPVDERFDAVAIDERELLLHDRVLGRRIALPLSGEPARIATPATVVRASAPQSVHEAAAAQPIPVAAPASRSPEGEPDN